jgi:DNA modification methylase
MTTIGWSVVIRRHKRSRRGATSCNFKVWKKTGRDRAGRCATIYSSSWYRERMPKRWTQRGKCRAINGSIWQKDAGTLNTREAKGEGDTKHICALQLGIIDRCVRLYSNPGDIVFSGFAGIGSELYVALKLGRRAYGIELKQEYFDACVRNCETALRIREQEQKALFSMDTA